MTAYRRPQNLAIQLEALEKQSIKPAEIAIWHNHHAEHPFDSATLNRYPNITSTNHNWGVWPRFLFCSEFESDYVCVFDDDTIPGRQWLENCLNTIERHEGVLGAIGVVYNRDGSWIARYGWANPINRTVPVDIAGHAWFFKRDWIRYYAMQARCGMRTAGEDFHFSVALQRQLGLGTYVPPHNPLDRSGWGSTRGVIGADAVALYRQPGQADNMNNAYTAYVKAGWKTLLHQGRLGELPCADDPVLINTKGQTVASFEFEQDFVKDFEKIDLYGKPFAFIRMADGELALCSGNPIRNADGWYYDGSNTRTALKLREIVTSCIDGLYFGISCCCCDTTGHDWYRKHMKTPLPRITFSNLFVNSNFQRFKSLDLRGAVLVSSSGGHFSVPKNALNPEFDYRPLLESLFKVNAPIIVAAGPIGKSIIYDYWKHAPRRQVIIDIGSVLDPQLHGRASRNYHNPHHADAKKICKW